MYKIVFNSSRVSTPLCLTAKSVNLVYFSLRRKRYGYTDKLEFLGGHVVVSEFGIQDSLLS